MLALLETGWIDMSCTIADYHYSNIHSVNARNASQQGNVEQIT